MEMFRNCSRLLRREPPQTYDGIDLDTPLMYEDEDSEPKPEVPLPIVDRKKRFYTALSNTTSKITVFLVPSFMQRSQVVKPTKITETSYLNGVRGLASFLVYFQH